MSEIKVVGAQEWEAARAVLLKEEKAVTQLQSELSSKRRELPVVKIEGVKDFHFTSLEGADNTLLDLFDGRNQLILYHFMLSDQDKEGCVGCSFLMDHIPHLGHLYSRDTMFVAVAPASADHIKAFKDRMGWSFPFYSSKETFTISDERGQKVTWKPGNGYFGIAVFLRREGDVFHTYSTTDRGVESILSTYALLDMTLLGRQEVGNGMGNFQLHDKY